MSARQWARWKLRIVPVTLHGRLLAGMALIVAVGLVGTNAAAYTMMRSYLDTRADRQLHRGAALLDQALVRSSGLRLIEATLRRTGMAQFAVVLLLRPDGTVQAVLPDASQAADPNTVVAVPAAAELAELVQRPDRSARLDIGARSYRGLYHPTAGELVDPDTRVRQPVSGIVLLAAGADQETLHRLAVSQAAVSAVALLMLLGLAVVVLRVGLRPLLTMAATAAAIADGDHTRRIPVTRPGAEVGQLAEALNRAFDERCRAEDRLRRFVADASHELRTPLTTIRGWADLYFQGALPGNRVETAFTRIAEDADRVSRLVEELLLLARLDDQRPLETATVDLTALVSEVVDDARVIDPAREITLAGPDPGVAITVVGDADRLRQVVRNLVGNALQHTAPGTPVRVSLQTGGGPPGNTVRLTVADTGPGIRAAHQKYLFERFYRADPTPANPGTGLGLAIVRAIVQAHGGTIGVQSEPGCGARFDVTLTGTSTRPPDRDGSPRGRSCEG